MWPAIARRVLNAFQQVEDYLAAVRILSQQMVQQQAAAQSAQRFLDLETARYETGVDPYIDVVDRAEYPACGPGGP